MSSLGKNGGNLTRSIPHRPVILSVKPRVKFFFVLIVLGHSWVSQVFTLLISLLERCSLFRILHGCNEKR